MTFGADRVTIDYSRAQPLWINGVAVSPLPGQTLTRAARTIFATAGGYLITYSTGETVYSASSSVTTSIRDSLVGERWPQQRGTAWRRLAKCRVGLEDHADAVSCLLTGLQIAPDLRDP